MGAVLQRDYSGSCLFMIAVRPDFLFMHDNARPHRNAQVGWLLVLRPIVSLGT